MTSGCIFKLRSSHCVCHSWLLRAFQSACGVEVPPTRCSKLGDVCPSQSTGVAPFLRGVRQRRSSARTRARGHFVNIMLIMRNRKNAFEPYKYGVSACLAFARLFLPGAKHKMLWSRIAITPPGPGIPRGRSCTTKHTPSHQILPPGTPVFIISLTGEKLWQADPNEKQPLLRLRSVAAQSICKTFCYLEARCRAWRKS